MRANMIAGNLQSTKGLGNAWDDLNEEDQLILIDKWQSYIESSDRIVNDIISTIVNHDVLGQAWRQLTDEVRSTREYIWERICIGDITLSSSD